MVVTDNLMHCLIRNSDNEIMQCTGAYCNTNNTNDIVA